ncbi:uncharacterized protein BJ212DRAFT_1408644 [Suillus subaureus]|uniref:Uncharacterized protein n=1 Tax=Suillus subaureus TaxID=48587 RepID=A0A9P7DJH4_9AGAM|nr:uncharacterized protein BJ212DRAFT_1408644 [Suillus subaureus]KAG1796460.1 hypothetical protein BJ212DRAFT_1408644 [Suillus subaureus]
MSVVISNADSERSECDSLCELEGSELEENMRELHCWMEAYRTGLSTKDAQFQVKQFSSTKYKSHRRIPETLARIFD